MDGGGDVKLLTVVVACILAFAAPAYGDDTNKPLAMCKAELAAAWAELLKPLIEGAASDKERASYRTTLQATESRITAMDGHKDLAFCRGELDGMALRKANAAALQHLLKGVD
jgi:hypothetical protein